MSRTIAHVVFALALAAACGRGAERPVARDDAAASPPPAIVDAVAAPASIDAGLRAHMDDHFGAAVRLQEALMRGELAQVRDEAGYLVAHPEYPELERWRAQLDAAASAAAQVKDAPDLVAAAGLSANLGLQCRRCHAASGAIVAFGWEPVPASDGTMPTRMKRHGWAAARMWEGLIGSSDELWTLGAHVMVGTELRALASSRQVADHDVRDLIARVQVLASEAINVASPEQETVVYGNLMATCVRCHQLVRAAPPVAP
jgi:hypothetical protein